jgi:hypothetical protein
MRFLIIFVLCTIKEHESCNFVPNHASHKMISLVKFGGEAKYPTILTIKKIKQKMKKCEMKI